MIWSTGRFWVSLLYSQTDMWLQHKQTFLIHSGASSNVTTSQAMHATLCKISSLAWSLWSSTSLTFNSSKVSQVCLQALQSQPFCGDALLTHLKFRAKSYLGFLQPSAQERHGPVGVGPQEGQKNGQRAGTPLVWGQAEGFEAVQPGEEKTLGETLLWPSRTWRGPARELERDFSQGHGVIGQGVVASSWKRIDLD